MNDRTLLRQMRYAPQRGLLFLSKGPRYVLTFAAWHANHWARKAGLGKRPWRAEESVFWSQLDLGRQSRAEFVAAAQSENGDQAARALLDYSAQRQQPRFFVRWSERIGLLDLIPSAARATTLKAADQAVRQTFCFRGHPPVTFDGRVDWTYRPQDNTDWMWDLNRHTYWITLAQALWYSGDSQYSDAFARQLTDWVRSNPPGEAQLNWSSPFEVACRINTWLWAYHLFLYAGALDADTHLKLLRGLWTHGAYLNACLELHVPNNHLLLEAKALTMLGLLLPEFRAAQRWRQRGLRILKREVRRQVCADGTHAERVPHYHRLIAGELLELLVLMENNVLSVAPDLLQHFRRMLEFERHITRPDGHMPLFSDSAHGDPCIRFAPMAGAAALLNQPDLKLPGAVLDEMTVWLLGPERARRFDALPAQPPAPSRSFPVGGYAVMRGSWGTEGYYLAMDCGPFGYWLSPGHGHADALTIELHALGYPQIVDSGVYSFHLGNEWRNAFRSTRAHNTVTVDGQDQSLLLDGWHVWHPASTTLHRWATGAGFDYADASHDGYHRAPRRIIHRRQVFFVKPEYWIVLDSLSGNGRHQFDLHFHLMPDAEVELDSASGTAQVRYPGGTSLLICPLYSADTRSDVLCGSLDPIEGWFSEHSGEKTPAPTLRYSKITVAPTRFITILYPWLQAEPASVRVLSLDVLDEGQASTSEHAMGIRIEVGPYMDYLVVDNREYPAAKAFGDYRSDGSLVYLRRHSADALPTRAFLYCGTELRLGDVPLLIDAQGHVTCARPMQ